MCGGNFKLKMSSLEKYDSSGNSDDHLQHFKMTWRNQSLAMHGIPHRPSKVRYGLVQQLGAWIHLLIQITF